MVVLCVFSTSLHIPQITSCTVIPSCALIFLLFLLYLLYCSSTGSSILYCSSTGSSILYCSSTWSSILGYRYHLLYLLSLHVSVVKFELVCPWLQSLELIEIFHEHLLISYWLWLQRIVLCAVHCWLDSVLIDFINYSIFDWMFCLLTGLVADNYYILIWCSVCWLDWLLINYQQW